MEKYTQLEEIGRGSFGVVWKAFNKKTNEVVAIKKLIDEYADSWDEIKNLKEIKSLIKMKNHPNIIKLKEIIKENKTVFLVFEYMDSDLFRFTCNQTKPLSETQIKTMCFQIFQGLAHMHQNGYIHRDIKPENILVSKGVVKIGDLGSARESNGQLPYTDYVTTRWNRAPEVLLSARVYDYAVDMWAMGAIMVELFNLEPLFQGSSGPNVIYKICRVLGTPKKTTWGPGIDLANELNYEFPEFRGVRFSELLPDAGPDAVNLIASLLTWHPCMRPTAVEVLQHPFFSSCYRVPPPVRCGPVGVNSDLITGEIVFKKAVKRESLKRKRSLEDCEEDLEREDLNEKVICMQLEF